MLFYGSCLLEFCLDIVSILADNLATSPGLFISVLHHVDYLYQYAQSYLSNGM
jgi:hypothetical protein